jgi:hypothetical protein
VSVQLTDHTFAQHLNVMIDLLHFNTSQVEGTCFLSGTKAGEPIADVILAVANKMDVDILVMGISGYG